MLQSKYLTEEGLKLSLTKLYDEGYRYIYKPTKHTLIYISRIKPTIQDDGEINAVCVSSAPLGMRTMDLFSDIFENTNYIDIANALNKVDWSKVPVDAKVRVYYKNEVANRHFAYYEDGKIYAWLNGRTSWTTSSAYTDWDRVELIEEI